MNMIKRHFLTLIELMIALGLALIVLSFALYFYRYAVTSDEKLKQEEARIFQERVLSGRLSYLFSRLEKKPFKSVPEQNGLTKGESLIFSFKSEAYAPTYHGPVLARLFVDPKNRLILAVWQYNKLTDPDAPSPPHIEVIYENVDKLTLEFLAGGGEEEGRGGVLRPGNYTQEWKDEYEAHPAAVKIHLNGKPFAFPIASCKEVL